MTSRARASRRAVGLGPATGGFGRRYVPASTTLKLIVRFPSEPVEVVIRMGRATIARIAIERDSHADACGVVHLAARSVAPFGTLWEAEPILEARAERQLVVARRDLRSIVGRGVRLERIIAASVAIEVALIGEPIAIVIAPVAASSGAHAAISEQVGSDGVGAELSLKTVAIAGSEASPAAFWARTSKTFSPSTSGKSTRRSPRKERHDAALSTRGSDRHAGPPRRAADCHRLQRCSVGHGDWGTSTPVKCPWPGS